MKLMRFFPVLILLSALSLAACSSSDMTKVTIYFAKDGQASLEQKKLPLIDRFLNLFSSEAYAQHYSGSTDYFFLWITVDDDEIYIPDIPGTQSSVEIEVRSGVNRIFTLVSFHNGFYNYVGQKVVDLSAGETTVNINMYPTVNSIIASSEGYMYISWTYDGTLSEEEFTTLKIYRSCVGTDTVNCTGAITEVDSSITKYISDSSYTDTYYSDNEISYTYGNSYLYFIRINSPNSPNGGFTVPSNFYNFLINYDYLAVFMMGIYIPEY